MGPGGVNGALFVDWLTATQHHPGGGLPILQSGITCFHDRHGNCRFERISAETLSGSFDSRLRLGCDGHRVFLSGNVGRFGRQDNLFNHGWVGTAECANRVLDRVALPPFGAAPRSADEVARHGARIHRLDLTANFCAGSEAQARAVIRWIASRSVARVKRGCVRDESVWWANTRYMFKAYLKGLELMDHGLPKDHESVQFARDHGLVRVEVELKRRTLQELGLDKWEAVSDEQLAAVYRDYTELLRAVDRSDEPDILQEIPARYRMTAAAWLAGREVKGLLSNGTLYRHAKILREYGLDILQPRSVTHLRVNERVVELEPVAVPSWYQLDRRAA